MLTKLNIKNFALISHTTVDFFSDFSIITGETGAGKSIILDALGLVLGKRADLNALRDKKEKCVIEAVFSIENYPLQAFFNENDLDYETETVIRREILPSGKSRAFVNDTPVALATLQELGNFLIDIHSQHQTQELFDENYQLQLVDAFAKTDSLIENYKIEGKSYKNLLKELEHLKETQDQLTKELDYNSFLLEELSQLNLQKDEEEELKEEENLLSNVERIQEGFSTVLQLFSEENYGILEQLREIKNQLNKLDNFSDLSQRVASAEIELQDISQEIHQKTDGLVADPQRLEFIQTRLQTIEQLYRKHKVQTIAELLEIQEDLSEKVQKGHFIDHEIEAKQKECTAQKTKVDTIAKKLHEKRCEVLQTLEQSIQEKLQPLGMPNAKFQFELTSTDQYFSTGKDQLQLLFSANKGMDFGLLKKTASGGELSRIMLVVKSILASKSQLPTIIFDEIDTGVSGEVADKMGNIMKEMAGYMQVFAITHLPQVAAKGTQHYKVYKHDQNDKTISELIALDTKNRVKEIAQMLSGTSITDAALQQARELLGKN
ncbi:DNA repair protein RecN [Capnocytophaga sp. ARDL2]|uniref:DNA repair protein RecN n=1 Tax=Capnocytophaga sp. ARDL2 TaxID=3238809 RepID=UPI003557A4EA